MMSCTACRLLGIHSFDLLTVYCLQWFVFHLAYTPEHWPVAGWFSYI